MSESRLSTVADPALFRVLADQSPAPTSLIWPTGEITYVNPAFLALHEQPAGQLIGQTIFGIIDSEDQAALQEELRRLAARECDTAGVEVRLPPPSAAHQRIRYRIAPIRDDGGNLTAVMVFGQAVGVINPKPVSEPSLDVAQALFDKSPIPMWVFDIESLRFLNVNRACLNRYGHTREEFLQLTTKDIRPPEEIPKLLSAMTDITSVPYPATRWIHQCKDGSNFVAEVFATPIQFGNRPARLVLSFDVTDRILAERALQERTTMLEALGDNLPAGAIYQYISEPDGKGRYTHVSAGVEQISELKAEDLLAGRVRLRDLIPAPEDHERILRAGEQATDQSTISDTEVSARLPSGRERIWHIRSAIRRRPDNSIVWDGVILDVTDRRKLETQMRQAQKFQSVSVLAGGIAHDFNNLLTGVLGFSELAAAETPTDHPTHEYLTEIGTAARRAAELCKQMLAYAGKSRLTREPTDLTALVRDMTRLLRAAISRKSELQLNLDEELPPVEGDATQLRQVVMNLVTNASESLEEKPGLIIVRTGLMKADSGFFRSTIMREDLPTGTYAYLEVTDTGHGMTAETQSRIFEPFFTTKFSGRGLGLSALIGIVRSHRGAVRVTSEPGRGSTFRIVLPVVAAASGLETPPAGQRLPRPGIGPVLVIADVESVRNLARMTLEKAGMAVMVTGDGNAGVVAFREAGGKFPVVLTDLTMPKLSGLETLTALRAMKADVRVILMSSHGETEMRDHYAECGFDGFLQKPFSPDNLLRAIEGAMIRPA
ncbi:PAS domain-containing hybrid sensor histidine kinase/response regulator [Zavarzinella formosa]|uniref:PAS domain-containing hybrid sensor histidine kinase/response regulator n=1 Tax=Zavarzinella formosa TaxID=360055 RepID=UPI00037350DF|nr:PAS domain S-box protein [Zavarzinella formosa]